MKTLVRNFLTAYQTLCTLTNPATETKSIGLQADAQGVMVFADPSGQFYLVMTNSAHLSGLSHLDNFILTRNYSSTYRDFAKTHATATHTATQLNRLAVSVNFSTTNE
jgi:hypothetical protein